MHDRERSRTAWAVLTHVLSDDWFYFCVDHVHTEHVLSFGVARYVARASLTANLCT